MILALLALTACLPSPDSDWTLDDTGLTTGSDLGISGNLLWTTPSSVELKDVSVGLIHLVVDQSGELQTGGQLASTAPLAPPNETSPTAYELDLPAEPDGEFLYTWDTDLLGAPFLVVAWEESGKEEGYDQDDRLVGASGTTLVYLRGKLGDDLTGDGLQEGWNQMDFGYWLGEDPTSVAPVTGKATGVNVDNNLLPVHPESLSGDLELQVDDPGSDDLMVAAMGLTGSCEPSPEYDALSTTGTNTDSFNFAQWPGLAHAEDWYSNDLVYGCEEVPEDRAVDIAAFDLIAYYDLDGDRGFDLDHDLPVGSSSSNDSGSESSLLMYVEARTPLAFLYVTGEGHMGWNRISTRDGEEEASFLAWNGAIIR